MLKLGLLKVPFNRSCKISTGYSCENSAMTSWKSCVWLKAPASSKNHCYFRYSTSNVQERQLRPRGQAIGQELAIFISGPVLCGYFFRVFIALL